MLEKITSKDKTTILDSGCIEIRVVTKILDDGIEMSKSYFRYVISPGDSYSNEENIIQNICKVVHTKEVIDNYKNQLKINLEKNLLYR
jgi:hypothetical protein